MWETYIQELFAERIGGREFGKSTQIFKFEKIKRAKREAIKSYPDRELLDFGIGENDDIADERVREVLKVAIDQPENRGYADNGILEYKEAAAEFMRREFGVELDPETEINHCIGTKSALSLLPAAFINPGDVILMTVPGYPVAGTWSKYLGGEVYPLKLLPENNYYPDLDSIPESILNRAKLLVINYPNSPTGQIATVEFFNKVVEFAKRHKIVVVHDATHIMLSYESRPLSFLEVEGARDVGIETHSMSKGFNMIGYRLGFVAGNPSIVKAFADVKDNADSGQFIPIQKASAEALRSPSITKDVNRKYKRRLVKLVKTLNISGFPCQMPGGTFFLYVKSPTGILDGQQFENAEQASQYLIKAHSICTVPWDDASPHLRFSVTYVAEDEQEEDRIMQELAARLEAVRFTWADK